jgi:hypothetical protein
MNKYVLIGGPSHGTTLQTQAEIKERLYLNGNLYWPNGNFDEKGRTVLVWEEIKPRTVEPLQEVVTQRKNVDEVIRHTLSANRSGRRSWFTDFKDMTLEEDNEI